MISKFAQGMLLTLAFTTPEGRKIVEKTSKVAVRGGNKYIKSKYGVDIKSILNDLDNEEVNEEEE